MNYEESLKDFRDMYSVMKTQLEKGRKEGREEGPDRNVGFVGEVLLPFVEEADSQGRGGGEAQHADDEDVADHLPQKILLGGAIHAAQSQLAATIMAVQHHHAQQAGERDEQGDRPEQSRQFSEVVLFLVLLVDELDQWLELPEQRPLETDRLRLLQQRIGKCPNISAFQFDID